MSQSTQLPWRRRCTLTFYVTGWQAWGHSGWPDQPCFLNVQCYVSDMTWYTPLLTVDVDGLVRMSLNEPLYWLPMSRRLNRE